MAGCDARREPENTDNDGFQPNADKSLRVPGYRVEGETLCWGCKNNNASKEIVKETTKGIVVFWWTDGIHPTLSTLWGSPSEVLGRDIAVDSSTMRLNS